MKSSSGQHPLPPYRAMIAVGFGGVLGANARYRVGDWMTNWWGSAFPWGTLLINITGSLALGFFLTLLTTRERQRPMLRLFIATGFLGGYTTFSTFSYETVRLFQDGHVLRAFVYIGASLIVGLVSVVAGITLARLR
jgi:fluoride exporter